MANGKSDRKTLVKKLITIIIIVIASFLGINISDVFPEETMTPTVEGEFIVHMIDAGQADSFLLIQEDKVALVDCGTRSTGKDAIKYLKELGITEIDYLIGTHPHEDHMGGMYEVLNNFKIGKVIISEGIPDNTTIWYPKLMRELKNGDYNIHYAKKGDVFNLNDVKMKVIGAETDVNGNENNYSIVFKISFGEIDMIMTGDAETEVEEKILESGTDIDDEILKVGHHGSDTSSSDEFLDAITPEYGLISCKVGNKYEHPIKSTMEKLEERDIEVYRTDECGSVVMTITSNDVSFSCEPGDYLSGIELEERNNK